MAFSARAGRPVLAKERDSRSQAAESGRADVRCSVIQFAKQPEEREQLRREPLETWYAEYFVVRAGQEWIVSTATAQEIDRLLRRRFKPKWVRFVDITGAAIRIRSSSIWLMKQSTPETRDLWRRFKRERQGEAFNDVPDYDVDF